MALRSTCPEERPRAKVRVVVTQVAQRLHEHPKGQADNRMGQLYYEFRWDFVKPTRPATRPKDHTILPTTRQSVRGVQTRRRFVIGCTTDLSHLLERTKRTGAQKDVPGNTYRQQQATAMPGVQALDNTLEEIDHNDTHGYSRAGPGTPHALSAFIHTIVTHPVKEDEKRLQEYIRSLALAGSFFFNNNGVYRHLQIVPCMIVGVSHKRPDHNQQPHQPASPKTTKVCIAPHPQPRAPPSSPSPWPTRSRTTRSPATAPQAQGSPRRRRRRPRPAPAPGTAARSSRQPWSWW